MSLPIFKEPIVFFDCDDTLVSWDTYPYAPGEDLLEFTDPSDNSSLYLKVITPHVEAIKAHKLRGHTIIIWSAGGARWAETVVKRLGLEPYVDAVMAKPTWYYDDVPSSEFLPEVNRKFYPNKK